MLTGRTLQSTDARPREGPSGCRSSPARPPRSGLISSTRPQDGLLQLKAEAPQVPGVGLTGDPVRFGIAASLARPGGNVTGVSVDGGLGIEGKRLKLKDAAERAGMALMPSRVAELALEYRLPTVVGDIANARAGALVAYAVDRADLWRRAAFYVDRILRGVPTGELPIEQPTRFNLVLNLKTANALGLNGWTR